MLNGRPQQGLKRITHIVGAYAVQIHPGDGFINTIGATQIRGQNLAIQLFTLIRRTTVFDAWLFDRHRTDSRHDLTFRQIAVGHHQTAAMNQLSAGPYNQLTPPTKLEGVISFPPVLTRLNPGPTPQKPPFAAVQCGRYSAPSRIFLRPRDGCHG